MSDSANIHAMRSNGPAMADAAEDDSALVDVDDLQRNLKELDRQARSFIKENPLVAIAGAVVIGFVAGRLVMR